MERRIEKLITKARALVVSSRQDLWELAVVLAQLKIELRPSAFADACIDRIGITATYGRRLAKLGATSSREYFLRWGMSGAYLYSIAGKKTAQVMAALDSGAGGIRRAERIIYKRDRSGCDAVGGRKPTYAAVLEMALALSVREQHMLVSKLMNQPRVRRAA